MPNFLILYVGYDPLCSRTEAKRITGKLPAQENDGPLCEIYANGRPTGDINYNNNTLFFFSFLSLVVLHDNFSTELPSI